jgi:acyl CoA:acetate/3-ketoacid CoA transferase alpha subunit
VYIFNIIVYLFLLNTYIYIYIYKKKKKTKKKQRRNFHGKDYILESTIKGDFALIKA